MNTSIENDGALSEDLARLDEFRGLPIWRGVGFGRLQDFLPTEDWVLNSQLLHTNDLLEAVRRRDLKTEIEDEGAY